MLFGGADTFGDLDNNSSMKNPRMRILDTTQNPAGLVEENDDWENHFRFSEVNASGFAPEVGSNEPALMLYLTPGSYMVQLESEVNHPGDYARVEVYDLG